MLLHCEKGFRRVKGYGNIDEVMAIIWKRKRVIKKHWRQQRKEVKNMIQEPHEISTKNLTSSKPQAA